MRHHYYPLIIHLTYIVRLYISACMGTQTLTDLLILILYIHILDQRAEMYETRMPLTR